MALTHTRLCKSTLQYGLEEALPLAYELLASNGYICLRKCGGARLPMHMQEALNRLGGLLKERKGHKGGRTHVGGRESEYD